MKRHQKIILFALLVLLAAAVIGVFLTRRPPSTRARRKPKREFVDQRPLQTARDLAALAASPGERAHAARALRLADDEVDLAFATALRDAAAHPPPPTPETKALLDRINQLQARVEGDEQLIAQLKEATQNKRNAAEVQQQLDLANAELSLDKDALADAKQDFARAGGDVRGTIQRLMEEHEATSHANAAASPEALTPAVRDSGTLSSQIRNWVALRDRQKQLLAAEGEATSAAAALTQALRSLKEQIKQERVAVRAARQSPQPQQPATVLPLVQQLAADERNVSDFDRRIQDEEDLSGVYRDWATLVANRRQRLLNGMLQNVAWILLICVAAVITYDLIGRFDEKLAPNRKMLRSLRFVARFGVQVAALGLVLLVIFGAPGQMTTLLGLAGAGLTVALKDFIVAFFGWFVLMGKNGIRIGDWVEINGIGGEVVEVGLLRTVLLETGAWSDAGHPTGRKVVFVNSFAIEGHYFNFSTTGQWLWDELEVLVSPQEDPYPIIEAIQKLVAKETAANTTLAEQEWQRVARSHALRAFSATPAVNVKPTSLGTNISVRYITRAHERYDLRSRLYRDVVELLRSRNIPHAAVAGGLEPGAGG